METVTYTNPLGQSVKFADAPFFIQSVTGLGDVSANIQLQKSAYNDGSSFIDALLKEREIGLEFLIVANAEAKETYGDVSRMREHVASVLNPKLGQGVLKYENERIVRLITCIADGVPQFNDGESRTEMIQNGSVNFVAPEPYWRSTEITSEPLAAFVEMFEFPFDDFFEVGTQGHTRIFNNKGNVETSIKVIIEGPVTKPKIMNKTTGEYIEVDCILEEKDILSINTDKEEKSVLLNGNNIFGRITLESVLFDLKVGENEIEFTAAQGQSSAKLQIEWQEKFLAV